MKSNEKVDLLQRAINQLIGEEEEDKKASVYDDDVSKLLSQLDSWKEDGIPEEIKEEDSDCSEISEKSIGNEEVIKEIKEVKKQNTITHRLLSAVIVLTLAWQLSEVSLILNLKERLSNPVKSIGNMFNGFLKRPIVDGKQVEKDAASFVKQCSTLPVVNKIPELPRVFTSDDE